MHNKTTDNRRQDHKSLFLKCCELVALTGKSISRNFLSFFSHSALATLIWQSVSFPGLFLCCIHSQIQLQKFCSVRCRSSAVFAAWLHTYRESGRIPLDFVSLECVLQSCDCIRHTDCLGGGGWRRKKCRPRVYSHVLCTAAVMHIACSSRLPLFTVTACTTDVKVRKQSKYLTNFPVEMQTKGTRFMWQKALCLCMSYETYKCNQIVTDDTHAIEVILCNVLWENWGKLSHHSYVQSASRCFIVILATRLLQNCFQKSLEKYFSVSDPFRFCFRVWHHRNTVENVTLSRRRIWSDDNISLRSYLLNQHTIETQRALGHTPRTCFENRKGFRLFATLLIVRDFLWKPELPDHNKLFYHTISKHTCACLLVRSPAFWMGSLSAQWKMV